MEKNRTHYYAYMRISTTEERAKQKFTRQEHALKRYASEKGITFLLTFQEDKSGKSFDTREQWNTLEELLKPGDTVVMKDISRFTREAENGYNKYMSLMEAGVDLVFLDNPTMDTEYMRNLLKIADDQDIIARESTKFIAKILLLAELDRAEKERLAISQRTKDGMAAAKKAAEEEGKEWRAGRKPGQLDKLTPELEKDIVALLADRNMKQVTVMKKHHITRNTLKKYMQRVKEAM